MEAFLEEMRLAVNQDDWRAALGEELEREHHSPALLFARIWTLRRIEKFWLIIAQSRFDRGDLGDDTWRAFEMHLQFIVTRIALSNLYLDITGTRAPRVVRRFSRKRRVSPWHPKSSN